LLQLKESGVYAILIIFVALLIFLPRLLLCSSRAALIYSPFLQFPVNWSARGSGLAAETTQPVS